jgi:hypothetical protein
MGHGVDRHTGTKLFIDNFRNDIRGDHVADNIRMSDFDAFRCNIHADSFLSLVI